MSGDERSRKKRDSEGERSLSRSPPPQAQSPVRKKNRSRSRSASWSRSPSRSPPRRHRKAQRSPSRSYSRSRSRSYSPTRGSKRRHKKYRSYSRSRSRSCSRSRSFSPYHRGRSRSYSPPRYRRRYHRRYSRSPLSNRKRHMGNRYNPNPSRVIGVFGLSLYTGERDLREMFEKYGPIEEVQVVYDHQTGRSRGFSFIYYEDSEDAIDAKEHCNGLEIDGRRIRVDYSITKRPHTPTPGVYMGKPTRPGSEGKYYDDDDHYDKGERRSSYH